MEVERIPRSANDRADFLSRTVDYDDWRVKRDYFLLAEETWGPHSVDAFLFFQKLEKSKTTLNARKNRGKSCTFIKLVHNNENDSQFSFLSISFQIFYLF